MHNVVFIQYYYYNKEHTELVLHNGFSYVLNECKNIGDMYWVMLGDPLPITIGIAYISVFTLPEMFQVFLWAEQYPDVQFIVGGPTSYFYIKYLNKPNNVDIRTGSAEKEIFNLDTRNCIWKLDIPSVILPEFISATFPIDSNCYWGRCIFCLLTHIERDVLNNTLENLFLPNINAKWKLFLSTGSIKESTLYKLPILSKKVYSIETFIRSDIQTQVSLNKVLPQLPQKFAKFILGLEFPSDKMLKRMNKGCTVEDYYNTISLIDKYMQTYFLNFLLGWRSLSIQDINDLETFLNTFTYKPNTNVRSIRYGNIAVNHYKLEYEQDIKFSLNNKFQYILYRPKLTKEQQNMNREAFLLIREKTNIIYMENIVSWML